MYTLRTRAFAVAIAMGGALLLLPQQAFATQCKLTNTDQILTHVIHDDEYANLQQAFIDQTLLLKAAGVRTIYDLDLHNQLTNALRWEMELIHIKAMRDDLSYNQSTKRLKNIVSAFCGIKNEQWSRAHTDPRNIRDYANNIRNIERTINNAIAVLFHLRQYLSQEKRINLASR
jgi:hypothetical protein